jgi:preprotein translocase subunit SecE
VAAPRKRSKRRRAPQAQSVRARPKPAGAKPATGPGPVPLPVPDEVKRPAGPPDPGLDADADRDLPTLEEVDLAAGAPPEDLGAPTSHPPEDLAIVTGELGPDDDDDYIDIDDDVEPVAAAALSHAKADRLDAEDELLPAARNTTGRAPAKVGGNRVTSFLRASWAELQRVQWPNRRQVGQATAVVLGFVVIAGGYLGLADVISQKIVDAIL